MKKRTRSLIAVILTLALVLAIGIPGLAAGIGIFPNDDNRYTIQPVKHYDTYTVLGDSITAGVNCQDYYRYYNADGTYVSSGSVDYGLIAQADHWDRGDSRRVEGTYPALVEDMVTADTVNHFSRIGYRTDELRILLCDDSRALPQASASVQATQRKLFLLPAELLCRIFPRVWLLSDRCYLQA